MLSLLDLHVELDSDSGVVHAIDALDLAIQRGETFALVGQMDESQLLRLAEKATLARALNLREAPDFALAGLAERGFGRE